MEVGITAGDVLSMHLRVKGPKASREMSRDVPGLDYRSQYQSPHAPK